MMASVLDHVRGDRLWDRLQALAAFGARTDGGVDRPALSDEEIEARKQLVLWGREIGLTAHTDSLGNLFLRREGTEASLPPILVGSHIDSQPTGGRYDGVYGVLAALEAVNALTDAGLHTERSIEIVAWMNEEGSRFAPGMMGSSGFAGVRPLETILSSCDTAGISVAEALATVLAADIGVEHRPLQREIAIYVEAHIEQGPILESMGAEVGIVTSIQGKRTFVVTIDGEENHAGTSPRAARKDALVAAVRVIDALQNAMRDDEDIVRFTIGRLDVSPNAPSVVPSRVRFSIDLRHPDDAVLTRLGDLIAPITAKLCDPCTASVEQLLHDKPVSFPSPVIEALTRAATDIGIEAPLLSSGAGHDAKHLARRWATGMLFIPCHKGISHHPSESIEPDHALRGAQVLAQLLSNADSLIER